MAQRSYTGSGVTPPHPTDNGAHREHVGRMASSKKHAQQSMEHLQQRVISFVQEKPLMAMGIALVAGYLTAKLITRR